MTRTELKRLEAMHRLEAGTLTQAEVARQLGLGVRQTKRLWRRYHRDGPLGLVSKKRGKPPNNRIDPVLVARATDRVRTTYRDFGPTFAAQKLAEREGIAIRRETLRKAMIEAGLWEPHRRKPILHPPRERRPCFGELVQGDGSPHAWFEERGPRCTLLAYIDDATSRLLALRFAPTETTHDYFELTRSYLRQHGKPLAFYVDKHSIFRNNNETDKFDDATQFGRAMKELDIELICANSPQAKGRVERLNRTLQDRLLKELRLRNINSIVEANAYLPTFMEDHNRRFAVAAKSDIDAHRPLLASDDLDRILCKCSTRTVSRDMTLQYETKLYQIIEPNYVHRLRHASVLIREQADGTMVIEHRGRQLNFTSLGLTRIAIRDAKNLNAHIERPERRPTGHPPAPNHPWKAWRRNSPVPAP